MTTYKRILVPLDFSDASARVLEHAKMLAERFEASVELLHVVPNRSWRPQRCSTSGRRSHRTF